MNSEEAKNILQLCRPGHVEDLNDALITEALETLEQDSALCVWFEEQQTVDAEISAELCRITPAPDLKESILQGMQKRFEASDNPVADTVNDKSTPQQPKPPVPDSSDDHSKILWFRPLLGMAAVLTLASILLLFLFKRSESTLTDANSPADEMVDNTPVNVAGVPDIIEFLGKQITDFSSSQFDKRSDQVGELQSYLARSGVPNPAEIPSKLKAVPTIGCVTFDYNGTKMSMICFKNGKVYHLITISKIDMKDDSLPNHSNSEAQFFEHRKHAFKVWSDKNQIYILSTRGTREDMPEFI